MTRRESGAFRIPVDSQPILIRLRAIPNIKELVIKTSLVRCRQTRSSAQQYESRDMLRERIRKQTRVTDSAAIRSRVVPKLKGPYEKRCRMKQLRRIRADLSTPPSSPGFAGR